MKIIIKTKNLKLNQALWQYIKEKLNSLEKFSKVLYNKGKYFNGYFGKGKPRTEAWVEIGKINLHHQKGKVFKTKIQMRLPGKSLRAEAASGDLRLAIDEMKDELQRELKKYKNRLISKRKRGQRVFKKELHFSSQARFYRKGRIREEGI